MVGSPEHSHGVDRVLSKRDFKELFRFEENDRDKKQQKKEFRRLDKQHRGKLQFIHLVGKFGWAIDALWTDYYL
mgnify:CR=1 FL=1